MIPRHFQITIALLLLAILVSGVMVIRLRRGEQEMSLHGMPAAPEAPAVPGRLEQIRMLVAYDDDQALRWRDAAVFMPADRSLRARAVLRAVLAQYLQTPSPHPLEKGSDIKEIYLLGDDTMVVDTTSQFADGHPSGILLEQLTLTSLIETLAANVPGVSKVKFLVEGQERETLAGHADLMSFYQTKAVHELAKEFE
ncbi:MAG TPA: GerMN domain-containing protein [Candidatus Angelobacter sp.]